MTSIATLSKNLLELSKLLGMLIKGGLPEDYFGRLAADRGERSAFIAFAKSRYEPSTVDSEERPTPHPPPFWEHVSDTAIRVNLDATHKLPFEGAEVEWNEGSGWVTVERRGDDLYVDGKCVVLHLIDGQKVGGVQGYELRKQLKSQAALHPNVLDALYENPHIIPESWKRDEQGRTRFIFFWAVGYRGSNGDLCVRCLCWDGGAWRRACRWLDRHWDVRDPAAVLEASA